MGEDANTQPQPEESPDDRAAHIAGDYVDGDKITGDIAAEGVSGSGHHIGHRIYKDPNYPYDVRGLANPYLGLAAFTYADRARYAGREKQIALAVEKLATPGAQRALLFVTGASGSGKSSFAQAGLLPALEQHYTERHQTVRRAVFRPSQQPMAMLADALQQLGLPAAPVAPDTFAAFVREHTPDGCVNVIIIDQFEELFTQSEPGQRGDFFTILEHLPPFVEVRTHLIATVRADYVLELRARKPLWEHWHNNNIELWEMTEDELKQAIQYPLHKHPDATDKRFEAALIERLAQDVTVDAAYLPLLQVTLTHLWSGGWLKLSAYGTLTDALQKQAEEVYKTRPDGTRRPIAEQDAILALLLELVEVSQTGIGEERCYACRRLFAEIQSSATERRKLITELATARLLNIGSETRKGITVEVVDIIHESLIKNWPRLRDAITDQQEWLKKRSRFEHWLNEWEEAKTDGFLLIDEKLKIAQEMADKDDVALRNNRARAFLTASKVKPEGDTWDAQNSKGPFTRPLVDEIRMTLLGGAASGKSLFLTGMYSMLNAGQDDFVLWSKDKIAHIRLKSSWQQLLNYNGVERFPPPHSSIPFVDEWNFSLRHKSRFISPISIIDCKQSLFALSNEGGGELATQVTRSSCIILCVSGEHLINPVNSEEVRRKITSATAIHRMNVCLSHRVRWEPNEQEPFPVVIAITKYDLCVHRPFTDIIEDIKVLFFQLFARDSRFLTMICPVSIGKELAEDPDKGQANPVNFQFPIFFSLYATVRREWMQLENERIGLQLDLSIITNNLLSRLTNADEIRKKQIRLEQIDNRVSELKNVLAKIERELSLEHIPIYIRGKEIVFDP